MRTPNESNNNNFLKNRAMKEVESINPFYKINNQSLINILAFQVPFSIQLDYDKVVKLFLI